jgi:hypothetical protein
MYKFLVLILSLLKTLNAAEQAVVIVDATSEDDSGPIIPLSRHSIPQNVPVREDFVPQIVEHIGPCDYAAQNFVVEGIIFGQDGFSVDYNLLKILAYERDWPLAQQYIANGLVEGIFGQNVDFVELQRLAFEENWESAQHYVVLGLAEGMYGFGQHLEQNYVEIQRLSEQLFWPAAKLKICEGCAIGRYGQQKNHDFLLQQAKKGCAMSQKIIINGFAYGMYEFIKDPDVVVLFAFKNAWKSARESIVKIDAHNCAKQNLDHYFAEKWEEVYPYIANGLATGAYGIPKDIAQLKKGVEKAKYPLNCPFVMAYWKTLSLEHILAFLIQEKLKKDLFELL